MWATRNAELLAVPSVWQSACPSELQEQSQTKMIQILADKTKIRVWGDDREGGRETKKWGGGVTVNESEKLGELEFRGGLVAGAKTRG